MVEKIVKVAKTSRKTIAKVAFLKQPLKVTSLEDTKDLILSRFAMTNTISSLKSSNAMVSGSAICATMRL